MNILIKRLILMIGVLPLAGCASRAHDVAAERSPTISAAPRNADDEVLDVVLNDLLTVGDSPLGIGKEKAPPATILFSRMPSTYPRTVEGILMRHDAKQWEKLSEAQVVAAQEAAVDVVVRWKAKEMDPPFAPSDARVKLDQRSTTKPAMSRIDDRPVYAWRPGFTFDHQFAAVSLIIPWSMHHADATYLLEKRNGTWVIVLRQFVYYV